MKRIVVLLVLGIALGAVGYLLFAGDAAPSKPDTAASGGAIVQISLPATLSPAQEMGRTIFEAKCAVCHAENAVGKEGVAPPLVHKIYEPSHHGDESFQVAVAIGVRSHHWNFGNMPAVDGLTRADVKMIISYIRALQRENGIE